MNKVLALFVAAMLPAVCLAGGPDSMIPRPVSYQISRGSWAGEPPVSVSVGDRRLSRELGALSLPQFALDEAYSLTIDAKGAHIRSLTRLGAFRARQSLEQMLALPGELPYCSILDYPRFKHRGMHMDPSRHVRSKDFVLKQLEALASLKMNSLHLHLTDDAGWRMQIDSYPRLTSLGAWRPGENYKQWRDIYGRGYLEEGTPGAYGGYFTKDELREIVARAKELNINVIPEIEMPGHSSEVLAAYPQVRCLSEDGSETVMSPDFCAGSEETFRLIEAVLDEVMEVFPSEMLHIGGDEARKQAWKTCPRCKARMEAEGLSDVSELQSWFIRRIEKFVTSRGRRIIGWDEIMEGGLAPEAAVMSWRGTAAGKEAAEMGHDVVMSPTQYCYFDYYQDAPLFSPEAFGSYTPLSKVYSYDPLAGIPEAAAPHILGLQANLWAEYIPTDGHYEYMMYPRAAAIAEIGWTPQEERSFEDFRPRALAFSELLRSRGYNPFDLASEVGSRPEAAQELRHLARGCKVIYNTPFNKRYNAGGETALTDGRQGDWAYSDIWQGFIPEMDVVVDLGEIREIHFAGAHFLANASVDISFPRSLEILVSDDGQNFEPAADILCEETGGEERKTIYNLLGTPLNLRTRFVRFKARVPGPKGAFIFTDELIIN